MFLHPTAEGGMGMKKPLLEAKALGKSYRSGQVENPVIKHLDLTIYESDFTVVMGPSGSGKSTLLYCLSGMEPATEGEVIFEEQMISAMHENELADLRLFQFGFVFQQIHLVSNLNLFENVVLPGYLAAKQEVRSIDKRALDLLEQFQLSEAQKRLPSQVSGGEQQRTAIARSLINQPKLLFADEPTGALNRKNSDIILNLFSRIHEEGQSIIMVTHDLRAALRGNRVVYIVDGKVKGDLELSRYQEKNQDEREKELSDWLRSLEW